MKKTLKTILAALIFAAPLPAIGAETLPFTESFDNVSGSTVTPDHSWTASSLMNYPPQWKYATAINFTAPAVKPESGNGGFAFLATYNSTESTTFRLESSEINVKGVEALSLEFKTYVVAGGTGASVRAELNFDDDFIYNNVVEFKLDDKETGKWLKIGDNINVPADAETARIRFVCQNEMGKEVYFILDDIKLEATNHQEEIYPASVSDFSATLSDDASAINISLTAPTLTHATLGNVNSQPLAEISRIEISRVIGYDTEYQTVHTFNNPAPGETLTWADTELSKGGEYRYRALVYVGDNTDYGEYTDTPVTIGQIPGDITDFTILTTRGEAPAILCFKAPAVDVDGKTLQSMTSINITRYNTDTFVWDVIATLTDNLTPGAEMTYEDPTVESDLIYTYRVNVTGTAGSSYGVDCSVYIGYDAPTYPLNVKVALNSDGKPEVTWSAPAGGENSGYIDFENLTYSIYRGNNYSDYDATLLKANYDGTSFVDNAEFTDEELVRYFVKASNAGIEGYSAISNTIVVGPPSVLPYIENFDKVVGDYIQPEHAAWETAGSDDSGQWGFAELAYFILEGQAQPVDGGKGLAYVYYGVYSDLERDDLLTSGNILVEGTPAPVVTFHIYGVPGYEQTLDLETSFDGSEFASVKHIDFSTEFSEQGWQKVIVPLTAPAGAKLMKLRFHAHKGPYSCSVAIDNVRVDAELNSITGISASNRMAADEIYDLQGRRLSAPAKGLYIINGTKTLIK